MADTEHRSSWHIDRYRYWLIAGIVVVIGVVAVGFTVFPRESESNSDDRVQIIDPPRQLPDFELTATNGQPQALSDLAGSPTLLFFGYTHCPDVCPTTMAEFRQIKQELGAQGNNVQFVFISVDGTRDTPEVVGDFVHNFDPDFIGLTGAEDDVRQIGNDYFLFFQHLAPDSSSAAGYLVDHTAYTYLIDAQGRLNRIYPFGTPSDQIAGDLDDFVNQS